MNINCYRYGMRCNAVISVRYSHEIKRLHLTTSAHQGKAYTWISNWNNRPVAINLDEPQASPPERSSLRKTLPTFNMASNGQSFPEQKQEQWGWHKFVPVLNQEPPRGWLGYYYKTATLAITKHFSGRFSYAMRNIRRLISVERGGEGGCVMCLVTVAGSDHFLEMSLQSNSWTCMMGKLSMKLVQECEGANRNIAP
jgi:hypothetical protein